MSDTERIAALEDRIAVLEDLLREVIQDLAWGMHKLPGWLERFETLKSREVPAAKPQRTSTHEPFRIEIIPHTYADPPTRRVDCDYCGNTFRQWAEGKEPKR